MTGSPIILPFRHIINILIFIVILGLSTSIVLDTTGSARDYPRGYEVTISKDGKTFLFTSCEKEDVVGGRGCDIYVSFLKNQSWSSPMNLSQINTEYWESQPCLSENGKELYFVSNRPGGYGKMDIWKVNIDENPVTPTNYGVRGIPTCILVVGGELKSTKVGMTNKSEFSAWLKENT